MSLIYNHHCKQKNWLTYKNCNFIYLLAFYGMTIVYNHHYKQTIWLTYKNCNWYIFGFLWNVIILQSSLQTKKFLMCINWNMIWFVTYLLSSLHIYILQNWNLIYVWSPWKWTSFMYNHHCKEKTFLMYINWLLIYLLSLISIVTYTIVIIMANKNV
jgi:hypothetical protein